LTGRGSGTGTGRGGSDLTLEDGGKNGSVCLDARETWSSGSILVTGGDARSGKSTVG
jgi:hypothetical protein